MIQQPCGHKPDHPTELPQRRGGVGGYPALEVLPEARVPRLPKSADGGDRRSQVPGGERVSQIVRSGGLPGHGPGDITAFTAEVPRLVQCDTMEVAVGEQGRAEATAGRDV